MEARLPAVLQALALLLNEDLEPQIQEVVAILVEALVAPKSLAASTTELSAAAGPALMLEAGPVPLTPDSTKSWPAVGMAVAIPVAEATAPPPWSLPLPCQELFCQVLPVVANLAVAATPLRLAHELRQVLAALRAKEAVLPPRGKPARCSGVARQAQANSSRERPSGAVHPRDPSQVPEALPERRL